MRAWRKPGGAMAGQHRFVVVFNRRAGSRHVHETLRIVTTRFDGRIAAVIETTLDEAFAFRVRDAVRGVLGGTGARPTVVAVGGDGTFSLALNALAQPRDAELAVIPAGSGNDFALALGLPDAQAAIEALERHNTCQLDYGTVNERRFANCVGMGLDAEIGALAASLRRHGYPSGASYYAAALAGLFMIKPVGVTTACAGAVSRYEHGVMVTVGNGPWYGGGFHGAPHAALDDGVLDAYVFSDINGFFARFALMQRIRAGTHDGARNVTALRVPTIVIEFDRDVAMHVDGEIARVRRANIAVVPAGMSVVASARPAARQAAR